MALTVIVQLIHVSTEKWVGVRCRIAKACSLVYLPRVYTDVRFVHSRACSQQFAQMTSHAHPFLGQVGLDAARSYV